MTSDPIRILRFRRRAAQAALSLSLVCALIISPPARGELTVEQREVPLAVDNPGPGLTKIVLLAGSVSNRPGQHEYFAGCALMMDWLKRVPGVHPVMAAEGWPKDESLFEGAKSIVCYMDGGEKLSLLPPERWAVIRKHVEGGGGLVMLHQAVEVPADKAEEFKDWLGGVWQPDIGDRGHWDMSFADLPDHPILTGVQPFDAPGDGWLYNLHFDPDTTTIPILSGQVPDTARKTGDSKSHAGRPEVIAWACERAGNAGGRSFAFTGADLHKHWGVESQARMLVNAILWTAHLDIPEGGADVKIDPDRLTRNLDRKALLPVKKKKATPAAAAEGGQ